MDVHVSEQFYERSKEVDMQEMFNLIYNELFQRYVGNY